MKKLLVFFYSKTIWQTLWTNHIKQINHEYYIKAHCRYVR